MIKKIRFYKALIIEIIETLCTICLYLERDNRFNPECLHMRSHFIALKGFSERLRNSEKAGTSSMEFLLSIPVIIFAGILLGIILYIIF